MKDLVENRKRIPFARKLRLLLLAIRENGVLWALCFGAYYLSSQLSESSFRWMNSLRARRGLPGLNSTRMNLAIWEDWDWSQGGEEWTLSDDWKEALIRRLVDRYVSPGAKLLEIGPGAGRWTAHLIERAGHLTAIDISPTCIALCRERFAAARNAEFHVNSGSDLAQVPDRSIDVIWSFDVFVHINETDVEKYAQEFARVLKPGGRGIVHHGSAGSAKGGWRGDLTAVEFAAMLGRNGLRVVEQFDSWKDGDERFDVSLYGDVVTVFES
jgi:ubiquinone/menaquinone biosynthesis C-methylase UbiE